MTLLEALRQTTETIRDWINNKITDDFSDTSTDDIPSVGAVKNYVQQEINGAQLAGSSVQSDWKQTDAAAADYIKNKPEQAKIISESSTDEQYATAKAVYDIINTFKIEIQGDLDELDDLIGDTDGAVTE